MQITTSWERKGQSNTILRLLNRKLGSLPDATIQQIESLQPNQLDSLTEDLLDFKSIDDLNQWLSNS